MRAGAGRGLEGSRTPAAAFALVLAVAAGALGAAGGSAASGIGDERGDRAAVVGDVAQTPAQIRAYWTPRRMREAIPVGVELAETRDDAAVKRGQGVDRHRVRGVRKYPARVHGKVFFRDNGLNFVCSGTVVRAPIRSLVVTAGHCVYDPATVGGGFVDRFMFVPGFRGRKPRRPFGTWPATDLATTKDWKEDGGSLTSPLGFGAGDTSQDVGMAVLARRNGRRIQGVVGARGIAFNRDRRRVYHAFGYPAQQPPNEFNGKRLFRCDSSYLGADRNRGIGRPNPMRIACDMTGGASGGGWVSHGKVMSVNSYKYSGNENRMYGPYFGDAIRRLYRRVND